MTPAPRNTMTCDEAALALILEGDENARARALRHRDACDQCDIGERGSVPERIREALPTPPRWLLVTLSVLGVVQVFIALPWLVGSDPFGFLGSTAPATHTARDGVAGVVVGAAAVLSAVRPRWARPAFHIAAVVIVAQVVAGVIDSSIAETGLPEVVHLLSVLLVVLIAVCVVSQIAGPMGPSRFPRLRSVDAGGHGSQRDH